MKIRRLRIDGFGNLRGDFIFSSDRCNLILEPNESGKSTLAAAILAALYGLPRQRATRDRPIKMKEQYRPWSGGAFAVELDVDCRERSYTIRRDFDQDTVVVLDGATGKEITAQFSRGKDHVDLGEALTGLTREDFSRCCFVGQREIESLRDAEGLTHALQRIASSQKGDVAAGEALAALARAVDHDYEGMRLGRGKVETEIRRLEKEIDEVRAEMEVIAARRRASEDKIRRLEEATAQEGRAEADLARVDFLCLLAASQEAQAQLDQVRKDAEEIRRCREEIAALDGYSRLPLERLEGLREIRTRIESLQEHRSASEKKVQEIEAALARAQEEMAPVASFAALGAGEVALIADRQAVLADLWEQRRSKRQALRKEEKRLADAGIDPGRVTELASAFSQVDEDERTFLGGYRERVLELKAALSEAERERDRHAQVEGADSAALVPLAAARRAEAVALGLGFFGFALIPVLWFTLDTKLPILAALVLAVAGFIWWIRLQEKRPVHGAEEFGTDLQRIQTEIWSREKELAAIQERVSNLASRINYARPDRLVEEFRALETLQEKAAPLAQTAATLREIQNRYDAASAELLDLMQRAGRPPSWRLVTPRIARRFREEAERFRDALGKADSLRSELATSRREAGVTQMELKTLHTEAAAIFREGMGPDASYTDPADAVTRFAEAAARRERWSRLTQEILPAALRRNAVPPEERIATLTRELEVLSRQVDRAVQQSPALFGLRTDRSSREYVEERRRLQEEARGTQRDRLALSDELGDVLKEYRRDYPGRQRLLSGLEGAHARAVAFRDAVALSSEVLQEISREAYAQWAEVLNDRTGEILRRINPSYGEVLFDTDLTFTLRDVRSGRRLDQNAVDVHFSSGARDQIYLAVRMAVSEYLSASGTRLPFILDDPLATFDDERFERAMEFLLDTIARRHQVVILSCHEVRHRRWLESSPDRMNDKIRVLDLTPLST
ncbi:MAG TPA: AAA family ATPase [Candidatus Polarisedimenticolia bacterium]|jgi:DNA repair exonuclease SbcCD ATPase subunit